MVQSRKQPIFLRRTIRMGVFTKQVTKLQPARTTVPKRSEMMFCTQCILYQTPIAKGSSCEEKCGSKRGSRIAFVMAFCLD
ncbi:hypothetical protein Y032_0136g1957 [Ancylostoma ceylanicum]|uniref:Uncharacterized protein n=1 Tax=Ancylostoma ceylanicum TaxID=53326 RepID=A0A016T4C5_9BILA|nr:hypothetical protein Y032_0136g1957 [Ancylostoma ceylanicum]